MNTLLRYLIDAEDTIDGSSTTPDPQQPQPNPMDGFPDLEYDIFQEYSHHRRQTRWEKWVILEAESASGATYTPRLVVQKC